MNWSQSVMMGFLSGLCEPLPMSAQAHRAMESYATRLLARIEDCPGYQPGMEIAIVRRTPFGETVEERVALSSYYKSESQQLSIVTVPIDCEMDASTFIRVYYTPAAVEKRCTATLTFGKIAERRAALLEA